MSGAATQKSDGTQIPNGVQTHYLVQILELPDVLCL